MHKGRPLIIDSGTCNYGRREYSTYYRQSVAHNVVLFDGDDGHGLRYIGADATGPMAHIAQRFYRHFLWIGDVILIFDDIATHYDVRLDWLLHTKGEAKQEGASLIVQNQEASVLVSSLYPSDVKLEQRQGMAPGDPDQRVPYHAFVFGTRNGRQRAITAIDLNPAQRTRVECRAHDQYLEVVIQEPGETHRVYFDLRSIDGPYNMSSTISIGSWTTDAYLLALSHSDAEMDSREGISRFFLLDGSFLRHQESSVMESLSKASCLWNPRKPEVYTQSQRRLNLGLYLRDPTVQVRWNGVNAQGRYDQSSGLFHLRSFA